MPNTEKTPQVMSANDTCSTSNIFNNVPKLVVSKADSQSNAVEWKKWWQSFQMFLLATNLEAASEKRKIAILLHTVGEKGVEIYNSFNLDLEKITLSEVKNKFDNHFEPQKSLTMTRHSFFTRVQKDEETIDCFITDLQNKANKCEFGELKDSLIRDIFIANMSSKLINVKQRLLQENNPTLERTLTLAKTVIMAQENAQKIEITQCPDTVMHIQRQRPRSRSRGSSNKQSMSHSQVKSRQRSQSPFSQRSANNKTCGRCGQFHRFKCPAQGGLGCLPPVCRLKLQDNAVPCVDPPRKVPFGLYSKLKEELDRMSEMNVIEKVTHPTEWVNSVVVTVKKSGQLRICLDPRNLNKYIIREHYPLKSIDEIRSILKGASYFSHLDAFSGFWMLKLDSASSDLCTFQTPFGRYRYLRLPYGINAASEIFHRVMTEIFADLEGVLVFVDDILVYGETEEIHNKRLYKVMQRAREVNLKLNKDKCKFSVKEVCFLGYVFSKEGAKVDQEKVKAIVNMPTPTNVKELQRVLGMINYLGPFIQNMSEKTQVLRNLLKKDSVWVWDENCEKSFQSLKNAITNAPVLAHYNPNIPIVLSVDSSKKALGAVLMQNKQPIAYSSKTLTTTQERYAQIEKELFAIQFGCEKFHQYVYGNKYRNTPKANFPSPAQLLMSRNLRMHIPVTNKKLKPKVVTFSDYKKSFDKDRAQSRSYYNRNKKPLPLLQPGDHVTFKKNPNSDWLPAIVKERLKCQRSYIIEDSKGNRYRRNRVQIRFTSNESCHKFDSEVPSNASETQINQREEEPSERQVEADHDSFTDSFMDSVHKPKEFYKKPSVDGVSNAASVNSR
ncbi:uncharacterized protein LOC123877097 [Maniola jurtina]|uniref:uncharacterized protein LOC123877097 n=1 Tax=Maniola jurtina TaxID=191418 RepID=UPI001E6874D1|nr:uncharacterized protein LOC123877097 [Maniola jurtina]